MADALLWSRTPMSMGVEHQTAAPSNLTRYFSRTATSEDRVSARVLLPQTSAGGSGCGLDPESWVQGSGFSRAASRELGSGVRVQQGWVWRLAPVGLDRGGGEERLVWGAASRGLGLVLALELEVWIQRAGAGGSKSGFGAGTGRPGSGGWVQELGPASWVQRG